MRILYISNEDVPADHAGAVHTWEVARGLVRRGHSVTLISASAPGKAARERLGGVDVFRADMRVGPGAGIKCDLRAARLLVHVLGRGYDAIMERFLTLNGLGTIAAAITGAPLLLEVNSPHLEEVYLRWNVEGKVAGRALERWVDAQFKRADIAFAPNPAIIRPVCRERARKILWGVDENSFGRNLRESDETRAIRERLNLEGRFAVFFVGSFHPWQGVADLPAIIGETAKQISNVKFVLAGDGPLHRDIVEKIASAGMSDRAVFLGRQPHSRLPYLIAAADAALAPFNDAYYPPLAEFGFFWAPTKVLEYAASGLPVVTADYPVLDEIVPPGGGGILVRPGEPTAYAEALAELAADPAKREAMGAFAETHVKENFGWRRHAEILEGFIEEAINIRKNR
ncbi:MAG: glycosyltransferase [Candidatus Coatesbacteria bacterium]|nr:MAG: glycosyltransferase [Candidatus Coatesbacteria bacterium]